MSKPEGHKSHILPFTQHFCIKWIWGGATHELHIYGTSQNKINSFHSIIADMQITVLEHHEVAVTLISRIYELR